MIKTRTLRSSSWLSTSYSEELWDTERAKWSGSSYLVNNLVSPVLFHEVLSKIPSDAITIEIAPHCIMKAILKRSLHPECEFLSLMNRKESDNLKYFLCNIGKMYASGINVNINKLYPPVKYPLGVGVPPLSPGIRWDHSMEWAVPSAEEFLKVGSSSPSVTLFEIGEYYHCHYESDLVVIRDHPIFFLSFSQEFKRHFMLRWRRSKRKACIDHPKPGPNWNHSYLKSAMGGLGDDHCLQKSHHFSKYVQGVGRKGAERQGYGKEVFRKTVFCTLVKVMYIWMSF